MVRVYRGKYSVTEFSFEISVELISCCWTELNININTIRRKLEGVRRSRSRSRSHLRWRHTTALAVMANFDVDVDFGVAWVFHARCLHAGRAHAFCSIRHACLFDFISFHISFPLFRFHSFIGMNVCTYIIGNEFSIRNCYTVFLYI